jgi:hypothetical protein
VAGRCSRWGGSVVVAGLGSSVAWRWCSGRCRRSQWSRCSRQRTSPAAPVRAPGSSFPAPSSPGAARRRRAPPLARRRCAGVAASLLGPAQRRRLLLPPSHGALSGEVERENPNGVGSLDGWLSASPPSLLNPGTATARRNPQAAPAWTARATEVALLPPSRRLGRRGVCGAG